MVAINRQELRSLRREYGTEKTVDKIVSYLKEGKLSYDDISVRDMFEGMIDDGTSVLNQWGRRKSGIRLTEAVDTSAFTSINGQIFYNKLLDKYQTVPVLWRDLVDTSHKTNVLGVERIAGIGAVGDKFETVDEGTPYPFLGLNQEYIDAPATIRAGGIIPVTRDIVVADQTGLLLGQANTLGEYYAIRIEKRVLDMVTHQTGFATYERNDTASATYQTSGGYINQQANAFVDYTDVENAETLLSAITDPNTGEPMLQMPSQILVPLGLYKTAERFATATQVGVVDNQVAAATIRQYSPKPGGLPGYGSGRYQILSNAYVSSRQGNSTTWYLGDFKKAFGYRSVWEIETSQMGKESWAAFERDLVMLFKVSERGREYVKNPRYVVKNTG